MRTPAMKKAAVADNGARVLWRVKSINVGSGLVWNDTRGAGRRQSLDRATMAVRRRTTARELGGLLYCLRRMTAAPVLSGNVAFSLGVVRTHGLIAPALDQSCGLMPCGKPSGLPFPKTRSANPHGVAHLLAEVSGFRHSVLGAQP